jgi:hypothetical protein
MRLKPHAGIESLLKQARRDSRQSFLADFAYQREVKGLKRHFLALYGLVMALLEP